MIRVIASFKINPDKVDEAIKIAGELIAETRKEKGCAQYDLVQSMEQANQLTIIEGWETQEDLDNHSASEHFARLVPQIGDVCIEPPSISGYLQLI